MENGRFLPRDAMLSAVHAVVVYLSVRLSVYVCVSVTENETSYLVYRLIVASASRQTTNRP